MKIWKSKIIIIIINVKVQAEQTTSIKRLTLIPMCMGKSDCVLNVGNCCITGTMGNGHDIILSAWKQRKKKHEKQLNYVN